MIEIHIANRRDHPYFGYEAEVVPRIGEDVYRPETGELFRVVKVQHMIDKQIGGDARLSFVHCQVDKL